jgi:hypothetical protein
MFLKVVVGRDLYSRIDLSAVSCRTCVRMLPLVLGNQLFSHHSFNTRLVPKNLEPPLPPSCHAPARHLLHSRLHRSVVSFGRVPPLAGDQAPSYLAGQEPLLLLDLLEYALVLVGPPGQVGQHFVDRTVGDVLVRRITGLTWTRQTSPPAPTTLASSPSGKVM